MNNKYYTSERFDNPDNRLFATQNPHGRFPEKYNLEVEILPNLDYQEQLKQIADKIWDMGFSDWYNMLKDISHWIRYLSRCKKWDEKDLFEFIEYKYSNAEWYDKDWTYWVI